MWTPFRDEMLFPLPDAAGDAKNVASRIREVLERDVTTGIRPGRVVVAQLPGDTDPGDSTEEETQMAIRQALRSKGKNTY